MRPVKEIGINEAPGCDPQTPFTPLLAGKDATGKRVHRFRYLAYKWALFLVDFSVVYLIFMTLMRWNGLPLSLRADLGILAALCVFTLIFNAFFLSQELYSYHLIFSASHHMGELSKAFFWSFLTITVIFSMLQSPDFLEKNLSFPAVMLGALGVLLVSRLLWDYLLNILRAAGLSFLAVGLVQLLGVQRPADLVPPWEGMLLFSPLLVVATFLARYVLVQGVFNTLARRHFRRQVVIVGSDQEARKITYHIFKHNAPFWVAGFVTLRKDKMSKRNPLDKPSLGDVTDLPKAVDRLRIDEIIVTDERIEKKVLISLLDYCTSQGLTVWFPPKILPIIDIKLYIDRFCNLPMVRLCSQKRPWLFLKIKHVLDIILALPLLFLISPLFLLISAAIKLDSKGPVLYKATAIGTEGRPFTMYKFRSMKIDTKEDIHKDYVSKLIKGEICVEAETDEVQPKAFKITADPRVTTVGRVLRRTSLDELPQLINVIKGNMSLIGPRPCLPYEFEIYKDWHKKRLSVRPGITGLWQVAGRSAVTFEDMVLLDLYYIYNQNTLMDMSILYETVFVVLGRKGAY